MITDTQLFADHLEFHFQPKVDWTTARNGWIKRLTPWVSGRVALHLAHHNLTNLPLPDGHKGRSFELPDGLHIARLSTVGPKVEGYGYYFEVPEDTHADYIHLVMVDQEGITIDTLPFAVFKDRAKLRSGKYRLEVVS